MARTVLLYGLLPMLAIWSEICSMLALHRLHSDAQPAADSCCCTLTARLLLQRKTEAADYHKLLMQRLKEQRERRSESLAKKRAVRMASQASKEAPQS